MRQASSYCVCTSLVAMILMILISCADGDRLSESSPSPPLGISLSLTTPTSVTEGSQCKISVRATIEKRTFKIVYPDTDDNKQKDRIDTLDTLGVHLLVLGYSSGSPPGMVILGDSLQTVTPIGEGRSYDFEFEVKALQAGQWRLVAEAFYLDSLWKLPPHYIRDCEYRYVWGASEQVTVQ